MRSQEHITIHIITSQDIVNDHDVLMNNHDHDTGCNRHSTSPLPSQSYTADNEGWELSQLDFKIQCCFAVKEFLRWEVFHLVQCKQFFFVGGATLC